MVGEIYRLPYPPSNNVYYRHSGGRTYLSAEGSRYKRRCLRELIVQDRRMITGPVCARIQFEPPDKRRRDLDNLFKAVFDGLEFGGLIRDDSQIKEIRAWWGKPVKGGAVKVMLTEWEEGFLWE